MVKHNDLGLQSPEMASFPANRKTYSRDPATVSRDYKQRQRQNRERCLRHTLPEYPNLKLGSLARTGLSGNFACDNVLASEADTYNG